MEQEKKKTKKAKKEKKEKKDKEKDKDHHRDAETSGPPQDSGSTKSKKKKAGESSRKDSVDSGDEEGQVMPTKRPRIEGNGDLMDDDEPKLSTSAENGNGSSADHA